MNPRELRDPDLSRLIARKMAKMHSMDVPIDKEPKWLPKMLKKYAKKVEKMKLNGEIPSNADEKILAEKIYAVDFDAEIAWLL